MQGGKAALKGQRSDGTNAAAAGMQVITGTEVAHLKVLPEPAAIIRPNLGEPAPVTGGGWQCVILAATG